MGLDFNADGHSKTIQDGAALFRWRQSRRTQPPPVEPASFHERVELEIPEGFVVDELPDSGTAASEFGSFKATSKSEGRKAVAEREVAPRSAWIPVEGFTRVVLTKK